MVNQGLFLHPGPCAWHTVRPKRHKHLRFEQRKCCRKTDPFQGPEVGSCLTLENELFEETHANKVRDFIGKRLLGGGQEGNKTQENYSAMWLTVAGFMVMGLVSGLSLTNHSDSGSFLVAHALLSQDGFQWEGFWEMGRKYGLGFPFSFWLFLNSSGLW